MDAPDVHRFQTVHMVETHFMLENLWISESSLGVLDKSKEIFWSPRKSQNLLMFPQRGLVAVRFDCDKFFNLEIIEVMKFYQEDGNRINFTLFDSHSFRFAIKSRSDSFTTALLEYVKNSRTLMPYLYSSEMSIK